MNWFLSIVIGLFTAVAGCFAAAGVAMLCVKWYRISSFEGGSGYYVVGIALLGAVVGLITGIVCSRLLAGSASLAFLKGLGLGLGSVGAIALLALFLAWLAADLPPTIDGHELELVIEIKAPVGFTIPTPLEGKEPTARVSLIRGRHQPPGDIRLSEATQVDGRWVIPTTVPLQTSAARRHLHAYINDEQNHVFPLPVPAHPKRKHVEWSDWVEAGWAPGTTRPAPEANFLMRCRVALVEPPPPEPPGETQAEFDAREAARVEAEFQAIPADAPVTAWFPYTHYGTPPERMDRAIALMMARPTFVEEMTALILGVDPEPAMAALRLLEHIPQVPAGLITPVREWGEHIAESLRRLNGTSTEPPFGWENDLTQWFSAWMVAVRAVQGKDAVDLTPTLHEILREARKCTSSGVIQAHITRVASYNLHQWAGIAPLPGDPPPR